MNRYKEKIGNILNKIKGNKRVLYLTFCTVLVLFCLVLNVAFGYLVRSKNINGANITIGDLKYKMVINDTALSSSVGTKLPTNTIIGDRIILLKAGKTEQFNMIFSSLNEIDTKYEIIYRVCTDVNCTSFIDTPNTIQIAYHIDTPDVSGTISAGKMKSIILVSDNQDDNDYYVQIDLNVGYAHNELALTNQISKDFSPESLEGNLSIIAYVNGVEVETFPTEPNYETGITCLYKSGSTSDARGVFRYSAEKGWEVDVFGLNRSLTTCRVDFTEVLKVTYEVLSTRYDCANVQAGSKPTDPLITYTGNCSLVQDTANANGTHTWRMKLLTSGELSVDGLIYIDAFLVGGGGGGAPGPSYYNGGGGGAGAYTYTGKSIRIDNKENYTITIGSGGGSGAAGGETSAFGLRASGGNSGNGSTGGSGGSGGGGGGVDVGYAAGKGGENGTSGSAGKAAGGGSGDGKTKREFAESSGQLYASGGSGGSGLQYQTGSVGSSIAGISAGAGAGAGDGSRNGRAATANTGSGGGGGAYTGSGGTGGSGIVVIRDVRS